MKIRNRILLYYSVTINIITAGTLILIYFLFADYREEQFLQQQRERIDTTLQLFFEVRKEDEDIQGTMDILTVYDYYDEKLMIFNSQKQLLYVSKEDIPLPDISNMLEKLSPKNPVVKSQEGKFEIVGILAENRGEIYFAISKAFDELGFTKMQFLRNILIGIFIAIALIIIIVSHFLSKKITQPITALTEDLKNYDLTNGNAAVLKGPSGTFEIVELTKKFNELLKRTKDAFSFQKHTVHHISHQLKTPIAVLVSELERIKSKSTNNELREDLQNQIVKAKSLGSIIHVLLEISKIESGHQIQMQKLRIDELIFDIIQELNIIDPDFLFEVNYTPVEFDEKNLILKANQVLIRQAFINLLNNCTLYSDNKKAKIKINCSDDKQLHISIINNGPSVSKENQKLMFNHFFRGENSRDIPGFGLGLVLAKRIFELHHAKIEYSVPEESLNVFVVHIPLS